MKIISILSGLINIIVLNICSLGFITPSSVCHLRTEFWLAVSFGDFSPIGWNDTKIFDPKDIWVDPARMSLGYSGSHAGSTKKSLKCPRGMKKTRSYSNTHLITYSSRESVFALPLFFHRRQKLNGVLRFFLWGGFPWKCQFCPKMALRVIAAFSPPIICLRPRV